MGQELGRYEWRGQLQSDQELLREHVQEGFSGRVCLDDCYWFMGEHYSSEGRRHSQ